MQPDRRRRGLEARHALGQQAGRKAREHVARSGGRKPRRRIVGDRGPPVGGRDHRVRPLEQDDRAGFRGGPARARSSFDGACTSPIALEQTLEFTFMRGQQRGPGSAPRWRQTGARGCSAKLVSASASSTTARSPASAASTRSCIPRPYSAARSQHHGVAAGIARGMPASSSAPSTGRTMTARLAAALTASASRGLAMVTSPAPARNAPRAASRAAPVEAMPARHHHRVAARIFVPVDARQRKRSRPRAPAY